MTDLLDLIEDQERKRHLPRRQVGDLVDLAIGTSSFRQYVITHVADDDYYFTAEQVAKPRRRARDTEGGDES